MSIVVHTLNFWSRF